VERIVRGDGVGPRWGEGGGGGIVLDESSCLIYKKKKYSQSATVQRYYYALATVKSSRAPKDINIIPAH